MVWIWRDFQRSSSPNPLPWGGWNETLAKNVRKSYYFFLVREIGGQRRFCRKFKHVHNHIYEGQNMHTCNRYIYCINIMIYLDVYVSIQRTESRIFPCFWSSLFPFLPHELTHTLIFLKSNVKKMLALILWFWFWSKKQSQVLAIFWTDT